MPYLHQDVVFGYKAQNSLAQQDMTKKNLPLRIAIIGMGQGGLSLAKIFFDNPKAKLIAVANRRQNTEGIAWAKEHGIYTSSDFKELLNKPDIDIVIDTSGNAEVEEHLNNFHRNDIEIIKGSVAEIFWNLIQEMEEKEREVQRSLAEQKMLYEIGISLLSAEKSDAAIKLIVKAAMDLQEMSAGSVALFNEEISEMKTVVSIGFDSKKNMGIDRWKVRPGGFTAHVLSNPKPTVIEDINYVSEFDTSQLKKEGFRSLIAVPLKAEGKIVGILYVDHRKPRKFLPREIDLMSLLGAMAASAIDKILLLELTEEMAITDGLTKIYNHRYFIRTLANEMRRTQRYHEPLSLFMIDVDHFKKYNDTHGHLKGNDVLIGIARLISENMRKTDTVARYGGEEFSVILPKCPQEVAINMAERLRKIVEQYHFPNEYTQPGGKLTISVGVATYSANFSTEDVSDFIEMADQSLYRSKTAGRNTVTIYT